MATQRWTIAKIGGKAGVAVCDMFREWVRSSTKEDEDEPREWLAESIAQMENFANALRGNAFDPAVVFFSEHVDGWSMGDLLRHFEGEKGIVLEDSPSVVQACYRLPDEGALDKRLRRALRTKRLRIAHAMEERWFVRVVLDAVSAFDGLVKEGTIVVLRDVVGVGGDDAIIGKACQGVPKWMEKVLKSRRA